MGYTQKQVHLIPPVLLPVPTPLQEQLPLLLYNQHLSHHRGEVPLPADTTGQCNEAEAFPALYKVISSPKASSKRAADKSPSEAFAAIMIVFYAQIILTELHFRSPLSSGWCELTC